MIPIDQAYHWSHVSHLIMAQWEETREIDDKSILIFKLDLNCCLLAPKNVDQIKEREKQAKNSWVYFDFDFPTHESMKDERIYSVVISHWQVNLC